MPLEVESELTLQRLHVFCAETSFLSLVAVRQLLRSFASCLMNLVAYGPAGCMASMHSTLRGAHFRSSLRLPKLASRLVSGVGGVRAACSRDDVPPV